MAREAPHDGAARSIVEEPFPYRREVASRQDDGDLSLADTVALNDGALAFSRTQSGAAPMHVHLGLVLVEDLAAHLGGRADVRSAPGEGTVVELEVPA